MKQRGEVVQYHQWGPRIACCPVGCTSIESLPYLSLQSRRKAVVLVYEKLCRVDVDEVALFTLIRKLNALQEWMTT